MLQQPQGKDKEREAVQGSELNMISEHLQADSNWQKNVVNQKEVN